MMGGGGIFGILLIVIVIWAVFQFAGKGGLNNPFNNKQIGGGADEDPLQILKNRYARGEISKEEYERMKNDLV